MIFAKAVKGLIALLTCMFFVTAGAVYLPGLFGINPYVVESASMEPGIPVGSLAFINENDRDAEIGDIVTYALSDQGSGSRILVTHRVIGRDDSGNLITKGDANKTQDLSPVPEDQLVGTYLWHVPVLGYFMRSFGGRGPAAAAAWIVILNAVVWIVEMVCQPPGI